MNFNLLEKNGKIRQINFEPRHIINAGYTGRDQASIQAHIDELKAEGIPAPDKTPVYFVKFIEKFTQEEVFEVLDTTDHSGEAEFVLLFDKGEVYVGVGSDHTDRKLETVDIPKAKQMYFNTIGKEIWRLSDVTEHWDEIIIRSWIKNEGERTLFQEAPLTAMLEPNDIIKRVRALLKNPEDIQGLVIYSGTVASLFKAEEYSSYFESELEDTVFKRKISNKYEMVPISDWYVGN